MKQLNLISNQTKEEMAIAFIREHEPEEGYFLGFSGGKDSVVIYDLAIKSGVKFQAYYSATGNDPPEVVRFIREKYPTVIHKRPPRSFWSLIPKYGFPTRIARWCCDEIKKRNTKEVPLKHRLLGIRAEESSRRAKRPIIDSFTKKQIIYKPIFYWLEWEIWDLIESNSIPYCCLYDEGFSRIGCVVCPFHSYPEHQKMKARWPKYFVAFEKGFKKVWDRGKKNGKPWREATFEEALDNWYHGK